MVECPNCGHKFEPTLKCKRCHEWLHRGKDLPKVCPNPECKSPYWNKKRRKKR